MRVNINILPTKRHILAIIIWMVLAPFMAQSKPMVEVSYENYAISGSDIPSLYKSLKNEGPELVKGRRYAASTGYHVNTEHSYTKNDKDYCAIGQTRVSIKITFKLPELNDSVILSQDDQQRWDSYIAALIHHENGHAQYGVDAAKMIEMGLSKLPAQKDCEKMNQVANEWSKEVLQHYREKNSDYDNVTEHGRSQGVVLLASKRIH